MDDIGIVYLIENAQQFWLELEDITHIQSDITLDALDATLKRFVSFCAEYHEQYLQSPLQLEHACELLLDSELFSFHSERMCDLLLTDARMNTDPHSQFILYNILVSHGRREANFLRSHKKWAPLLPILMDYVLIDVDPDVEDTYLGSTSGSSSGWGGAARGVAIPIEAKLRSLSVRLLYEVCRVQKLNMHDLRIFNDRFIDRLFDLVEETRCFQDDTFNYSIIKLLVALNEQFMVAALKPHGPAHDGTHRTHSPKPSNGAGPESSNRVLRILMSRLNSSQTFGENMIFMLNRASNRSMEDRCMQILVLKILYLLFTTPGTSEYFYTNDLCVLVDVFLRELMDLDEDSESLRHTFLRVLHPLLTKTQLRAYPYKRPQVVRVLESLVQHGNIRDIDPTTQRLVDRCLGGEWCVQFKVAPHPSKMGHASATPPPAAEAGPGKESHPHPGARGLHAPALTQELSDIDSPNGSRIDISRVPTSAASATTFAEREHRDRDRPAHRRAPSSRLKSGRSASVEHLRRKLSAAHKGPLAHLRKPANDSSSSLPGTVGGGIGVGAGGSVSAMTSPTLAHGDAPSFMGRHPHRADSTDLLESTSGLQSQPREPASAEVASPAPMSPDLHALTATPGPLAGAEGVSADALRSSLDSLKLASVTVLSSSVSSEDNDTKLKPRRRAAPPAPPKQRRKPPAIPVSKPGGAPAVRISSSTPPPVMQSYARVK